MELNGAFDHYETRDCLWKQPGVEKAYGTTERMADDRDRFRGLLPQQLLQVVNMVGDRVGPANTPV